MLALIYLGLAIALGDLLCRRCYRFGSVAHRYAAAILVGILLSTWFTYLAALAFAHTAEPLLWADLLFFLAAAAAIFWLSRKSPKVQMIEARAPGRAAYDWITLGALSVAVCGLLMGTLYVNKQGHIRVSGIEAIDFALQSAITQSFALGHNFPPEYPYYAGQPLHCDFLFYFQAGNLEFLGLNLAWSVGALSLLGMISMLALIMTVGELLFNSRVVGRVGAALAFFSGSLPVIVSPRSEATTGTWTPLAFVSQRHLPGAIGVLLVVLIFLIDQYGRWSSQTQATTEERPNAHVRDNRREQPMRANNVLGSSISFGFSGILLAALLFWSASVFTAAAAMLLLLLILFPHRLRVLLLGITATAVALPQLYFLRPGEIGAHPEPLLHWGGVDNPILTKFVSQLGLTFGAKWLVAIVALIVGSWFQWRFFIASCVLLLLAFCTHVSAETVAGHTFLNIWLVLANLFAAYGLWRLWKLSTPRIVGPITATAVAALLAAAGVIDLLSLRERPYVELNYEKDDLVTWLRKNTKPDEVFLTDRFLSHPILLAGRKIFLGSPNSLAAYDVAKREPIYLQMFESKNPRRVFELFKQNHIDYAAFDDGVRRGELTREPNEYLYVRYFQKVCEDKEDRYRKLVIYKVPQSVPANVANMEVSEPPLTAFQGGNGSRRGQFNNPHGIAVDSAGNIFVADTGNGRIQKFSPNGTFVTSMATTDPNGIAIDRAADIYVAEIGSKHRVLKLGPDETFIAEWAPGLYGPRRIAIGPDDSIYVVDSGHNRIVKFSPDGQVLASWGSEGSGDEQFVGLSSVAVDPTTDRVYVADPLNRRIQVFDSTGKFLTKWPAPEWGQPLGFEDLAIDPERGRVYASSAHMNIILVFDLQGNRVGTLAPTPPDKLEGPSGLALAKDKLLVLNAGSARVSVIKLPNR
jgi:DNA-binding beta-propeller fold protein YncE